MNSENDITVLVVYLMVVLHYTPNTPAPYWGYVIVY